MEGKVSEQGHRQREGKKICRKQSIGSVGRKGSKKGHSRKEGRKEKEKKK
jgi:hypothetical protein